MGDDHNDNHDSPAFNRYVYHQFADIVQHYNDTARPAHDDIDFNPADLDELDGAEYDDHGYPVQQYGIILLILSSDPDSPDNDDLNDLRDPYDDFFYDPRRGPCDRPRGFKYPPKHPDTRDSESDD